MSILSTGNRALATQAFAQTWDLLKTRRAILIPFYRNYAIIFGIAIFLIVPLALVVKSVGPIVAGIFYVAAVSLCAWYLSAMAIGTIVTIGAEYWHGVSVTTGDARKTIIPRMHAAMLADIPGMLQVGLIIVLSVGVGAAPNLLARLAAQRNALQIGIGLWFALAAVGACLLPVLSAYTALSIRAIARSDVRAQIALKQAHTEIFEHQSEYFAVMLYVGVLSFAISAICHALNIASAAHAGVFIISSILMTALQVFQLMPYVWLAQHFEPQAIVAADEATIADFDFAIPQISRRKPKSIVMTMIWICAGVGLFIGLIVASLLGILVHKANITIDPAEMRTLQEQMGLAEPPAGFRAEVASAPKLGLNGFTISAITFVPIEGPPTVKITLTETVSEKSTMSHKAQPIRLADKSCGAASKIAVEGSKPSVTIVQTGCKEHDGVAIITAKANFAVDNASYSINAIGDVGPDTISGMQSMVRALELRKIEPIKTQVLTKDPVQIAAPNKTALVKAKTVPKATPVAPASKVVPIVKVEHVAKVVPIAKVAHVAPVVKSQYTITAQGMIAVACNTPNLSPKDESTATTLTVVNTSTTAFAVEWIDYMSQRERMGTVNPGETWNTSTYATSPWTITSNGHCEAIFTSSADPGTITIK